MKLTHHREARNHCELKGVVRDIAGRVMREFLFTKYYEMPLPQPPSMCLCATGTNVGPAVKIGPLHHFPRIVSSKF
jgi:hypothetical protein